MKIFLPGLFLILGLSGASAQFYHNLEVGGSNFTGLSITTEYQFQPVRKWPVYIAPKLGVGHVMYWETVMSVQTGLAFGYQLNPKHALELNFNSSYLVQSPFLQRDDDYYFFGSEAEGNILFFNGIDWKIQKGKIRYTFGAGALLYFERNYFGPGFEFAGDALLMLKLGIGL